MMNISKEKNYITPKGHKVLVDELNQLVQVERPEILKVIQWAAGNGDRSENADYIYGKRRLRQIDSRSRFLRKRISLAVIVDPKDITSEKVQFGARVSLEDEEGNEKSYRIIGVDEIDLDANEISWKSPIGNSLIGKVVGDEVIINTPTVQKFFEIIKIEY